MATDLVKIIVPIGDENPAHPERLWARSLGGGLYELMNVPLGPYGLNFGDIVRCRENGGAVPVVEEVVTPSGHRTLRVFFNKTVLASQQRLEILAHLRQLGAQGEGAGGDSVALNVDSGADYAAVLAYLEAHEVDDRLFFEEAWRGVVNSGGGSKVPVWPAGPAKKDTTPGRNEPCWCGSGKKYKVCHGRPRDASVREPLTFEE